MERAIAEALMLVDETCARLGRLVARGRALAKHRNVPRDQIRGLRNRIGHDYHSVDDDILWGVVSRSVPELRQILASEVDAAKRRLGRRL